MPKTEVLCTLVENIIKEYPIKLNKYREVCKTYTPEEALKLMNTFDKYSTDCTLSTDFMTLNVLETRGMVALKEKLNNLVSSGNFQGVYVCEPYSFMIGCCKTNMFLVDTHPVGKQFGGDDANGIVVSYDEETVYDQTLGICRWLWRIALLSLSVSSEAGQTFTVLKKRYTLKPYSSKFWRVATYFRDGLFFHF